jgi:hypothetical protein
MSVYETNLTFAGDTRRALDFIATTLAAAGFAIEQRNDSSLRATCPGMTGRRQNALGGLTWIEVSASSGLLSARAEAGKAKMITLIMAVMMAAMAVGFFLVFSHVPFKVNGHARPESWHFGLATLLPFAPWIVLLPLIYRIAQRAARGAVDRLLKSAAVNSTVGGS